MRPPDDCWTRVKVALGELGVDADTVMVGKRSLREELEQHQVQNFKEPTARQRNEMIEEVLAEMDALRDRFARWTDADGREHLPYIVSYASEILIEEAEAALAALAEDLRSSMVANPKHDTHGAAKLGRDHYWFALSDIFVRWSSWHCPSRSMA